MDCVDNWGDASGTILDPGENHDFTIKSDVGEDILGIIPNVVSACQYEPSEGQWELYSINPKNKIGSVDFNISRIPGQNHISDDVKDGSIYDIQTYEYEDKLTSGHDTMVIEIRPKKDTKLAIHYENWMGDTLSHSQDHLLRPLNQIIIPGSHDSSTNDMVSISNKFITSGGASALFGSYPIIGEIASSASKMLSILGDSAADIVEDLSKAQNTTVLTQLNGGIRYFDLRTMGGLDFINGIYADLNKYIGNDTYFPHGSPKLSDDDLYLQHSFIVKDQTALQVVKEAATFAKSHPKEVVILHFQDMLGVKEERTQKFFTTIYNNYKDIIATSDKFKPNDPYEKFFGHNLIIIAPKDDGPSWAWQSDKTIKSNWANEVAGDEDKIFEYNDQKLAKRMKEEPLTLFVSQLQSTPNTSSVVTHITRSLVMDGYDAKEDEYGYLTDSPYFAKYGNIFIDDVTDPYQEVQLAINLNNHSSRTTFSNIIPGNWSQYCRLANESGEFYTNSYALTRERVLKSKVHLYCSNKGGTTGSGLHKIESIEEIIDYANDAECSASGLNNCINNPTSIIVTGWPHNSALMKTKDYPQAAFPIARLDKLRSWIPEEQSTAGYLKNCINVVIDDGVIHAKCAGVYDQTYDNSSTAYDKFNSKFVTPTVIDTGIFIDQTSRKLEPFRVAPNGQITAATVPKYSKLFDTKASQKITSTSVTIDNNYFLNSMILKGTNSKNLLALHITTTNDKGKPVENIIRPGLDGDSVQYAINSMGILYPKGVDLNNSVPSGLTKSEYDTRASTINTLAGFGYPIGQYMHFCTDIRLYKQPILVSASTQQYQLADMMSAKCLINNDTNELKDTTLNITTQCKPYIKGENYATFRNSIKSIDGKLKCALNRTGNDGTDIPVGEYIDDCRVNDVEGRATYTDGILTVNECSYMGSLTKYKMTLDYLHQCAIGSSVSLAFNENGIVTGRYLKCDTPNTQMLSSVRN